MKSRCASAAAAFSLFLYGIAFGSLALVPAAAPQPLLNVEAAPPTPDAPEDELPICAVAAWIEHGENDRPDMLHVAVLVHVDWWVHSLRQGGGGTEPKRTVITVAHGSPRQVAGDFKPLVPPARMKWNDYPEWAGVIFECHRGLVVWKAPLAADGPMEVRGQITVQADSDSACAMPETHAFVARPLF